MLPEHSPKVVGGVDERTCFREIIINKKNYKNEDIQSFTRRNDTQTLGGNVSAAVAIAIDDTRVYVVGALDVTLGL